MCKRAIGLNDDNMLDVEIDEPAADKNGFTASRMEGVMDLDFGGVFAGIMPCN